MDPLVQQAEATSGWLSPAMARGGNGLYVWSSEESLRTPHVHMYMLCLHRQHQQVVEDVCILLNSIKIINFE